MQAGLGAPRERYVAGAGRSSRASWRAARRRSAAIIAGLLVQRPETLMAALLQTTIAGSLPKPEWLCTPGVLWAPWLLDGEALAEGKRDAVRLALFDQEHAGIDIVTDGEQTRRHFVTTLIENLDGVDFEHRQTVRIRNRYDAAVPVVVGPVARRHPIYVDDAHFLRGETQRKVKYTLPGPMTMVDTLYDAHYKSREKLATVFAEILNQEAL